jgi:hypothetical protein
LRFLSGHELAAVNIDGLAGDEVGVIDGLAGDEVGVGRGETEDRADEDFGLPVASWGTGVAPCFQQRRRETSCASVR